MGGLAGEQGVTAGDARHLSDLVGLLDGLAFLGFGGSQRGLKVHGLMDHGLGHAVAVTGLAGLVKRGAGAMALAQDVVQLAQGRGHGPGPSASARTATS